MRIDTQVCLEELTALQRLMGVIKDPEVDLETLGNSGFEVDLSEVVVDEEGLLNWRGRLVIFYIPEPTAKYHLTGCSTMRSMRTQGRSARYSVTNRIDGLFSAFPSKKGSKSRHSASNENLMRLDVCKNCLIELDWDGYSRDYGKRHQIFNAFVLSEYFEVFSNRASARIPEIENRAKKVQEKADKHKKSSTYIDDLMQNAAVYVSINGKIRSIRETSEAEKARGKTGKKIDKTTENEDVGKDRRKDSVLQPIQPIWSLRILDEQFRKVFLHLESFGTISEREVTVMVGGPRRFRRFSRCFEKLEAKAPFKVRVEYAGSEKRYQKVS